MVRMEIDHIKKQAPMIIVTFIILLASGIYTIYLMMKGGQTYVENETALGEAGAALGPVIIAIMVFIYLRSVLKLIVMEGAIWERLSPVYQDISEMRTVLKKLLFYLNKAHPVAGALAIAAVFFHCYFTSNFMKNLLLWALLGLMVWQGVFGMFLSLKFTPLALKKKSYLVHAQVLTGLIIIVLTGLGHIFLED